MPGGIDLVFPSTEYVTAASMPQIGEGETAVGCLEPGQHLTFRDQGLFTQ
jgi:hypothetical protein